MADAEYTVTTKDGAEFTITAPEGTPSEEISKRARAVIEGTAQTPAEASKTLPEQAGEFGKGLAVGAAKATEAFPGAMASMLGAVGRGAESLSLGDPAEAAKREQFRAENKPFMLTGGLHAPESLPGKYGETIGEFLPVTAAGPGSWMRRISAALFGGGVSETAGQVAKRGKIGELFVGSDASEAKKEKANQIAESVARLAGALTPATLELLWRRNPDRMMQVVNDLEAEAAGPRGYGNPAVRNLQIRTAAVQAEAMQIYNDLYRGGMRETSAPGTDAALNDMMFVPPPPPRMRGRPQRLGQMQTAARTHVNIDDIQSIRQNLRDVAGNFNNPVDQRYAEQALTRIDDFLERLPQSSLLRGNAQAATAALSNARGDWWAARSLDAMGDKLDAARWHTASSHSGTNFDNTIRQQVRSLLKSPKQRARYTDEEIVLMERIVEGTAPQNLMRRINKLLPRSGVLGSLLHGTLGMTFGPAGMIPAMAGEAAAGVESRFANRLVRDLQRTILERSPAGQAGRVQLPPRADIPNFATPAAAGSLSGYLQERRETPTLPALEKRSSLNPDEGLAAATKELGLTEQEQNLYRHHLTNLSGAGKVIGPGGEVSTIKQVSVELDGRTYNIPTVWGGKIVSNKEAIDRAAKVGWDKWPSYGSEQEAQDRYDLMHQRMERDVKPEKRSSLNPDEGRVVSDVDERPIAGQQYAMMNEDDLRNPLGRRPLATPIFGGPGAPPSKPTGQLPPVEPRPTLNYQSAGATRQQGTGAPAKPQETGQPAAAPSGITRLSTKPYKGEKAGDIAARSKESGTLDYRSAGSGPGQAANQNVSQQQKDLTALDSEIGAVQTKLYGTTNANEETILAKRLQGLQRQRQEMTSKASNENVLSAGSHQRPIPEEYLQPKTFMQRIFDNTKNMNRDEILQSEPIWGGARQLSESGKMSFRDAFHLLVEQRTGYGLTSQEWAEIAEQAMKYGIR